MKKRDRSILQSALTTLLLALSFLWQGALPCQGEARNATALAQGRTAPQTGKELINSATKELTSGCLSCFKESLQITREYGDRVWKGFGQMNMRINIIAPHSELFLGESYPPAGYQLYTDISRIPGKPIYFKKRDYRHEFISTIEIVEGKPTLYISSKEVFEKTYLHSPLYKIAEDYIFIILQGYFHLYLMNSEALFNAKRQVNSDSQQDLSEIKKKYPYLDFINAEILKLEGTQLFEAYQARDIVKTREHTLNFLRLRKMRQKQIKEDSGIDSASYENWLEWYDGLAKYTEIELSELIMSGNYRPCKDMQDVANFKRYVYNRNKMSFEILRLKSTKNSLIHAALGMMEALTLDRLDIKWKEKLFEPNLYLIDILWDSFQKDLFPGTHKQH